MIVIGLTGSIGMGKSATARLFAKQGVPVFDADEAVHALYDVGGEAVEPIGRAFPGVVKGGRVDRTLLGQRVLGNREALARVEAIVHPLVGARRQQFLDHHRAAGSPAVVLDIPLLFEIGASADVDVIVVVTAPPEVQRKRVLERPGMSHDKLENILAKQVPDTEKRAGAHYLVFTDKSFDHAEEQVKAILEDILANANHNKDAP